MDAAFGCLEVINAAKAKGIKTTASINTGTQSPMFWKWMKWGLANGEGRVFCNRENIIASIHFDNKAHCVFTNSFKISASVGENEIKIPLDGMEVESTETPNVEAIQKANNSEQEWQVIEISKRKKEQGIQLYKTKWSTGEVTWEKFSCFVDAARVSLPFIYFAQKKDWEDGFASWTVQKLKEICTNLGISRCMLFNTFFA